MNEFQFTGRTYADKFVCSLEGDEIVRDNAGERQVIGMRITAYKEIEEVCQQYYDRLVELGEIVPEKTQEELLAETQKALQESQEINIQTLQMVQELKREMEAMRSEPKLNTGNGVESSAKPKRARSSKSGSGLDSEE